MCSVAFVQEAEGPCIRILACPPQIGSPLFHPFFTVSNTEMILHHPRQLPPSKTSRYVTDLIPYYISLKI